MERMFGGLKDGPGRAHTNPNSKPNNRRVVYYISVLQISQKNGSRPESKQLRKRNMQATSHSKLTCKNKANF